MSVSQENRRRKRRRARRKQRIGRLRLEVEFRDLTMSQIENEMAFWQKMTRKVIMNAYPNVRLPEER